MIVRGPVNIKGLSTVVMVLWNRAGQVWDFENSDWKSWGADTGVDHLATTEIGDTGVYQAEVPSGALPLWVEAYFHETNKTGDPYAVVANSQITDATLLRKSMIHLTACRYGGATPVRNNTTGKETYKDAEGVSVMEETPGTETAVRTVLP